MILKSIMKYFQNKTINISESYPLYRTFYTYPGITDLRQYRRHDTFSLYKNYPTGKFTTTDKIATDWFLIEELIPTQEWSMTCLLYTSRCV